MGACTTPQAEQGKNKSREIVVERSPNPQEPVLTAPKKPDQKPEQPKTNQNPQPKKEKQPQPQPQPPPVQELHKAVDNDIPMNISPHSNVVRNSKHKKLEPIVEIKQIPVQLSPESNIKSKGK